MLSAWCLRRVRWVAAAVISGGCSTNRTRNVTMRLIASILAPLISRADSKVTVRLQTSDFTCMKCCWKRNIVRSTKHFSISNYVGIYIINRLKEISYMSVYNEKQNWVSNSRVASRSPPALTESNSKVLLQFSNINTSPDAHCVYVRSLWVCLLYACADAGATDLHKKIL